MKKVLILSSLLVASLFAFNNYNNDNYSNHYNSKQLLKYRLNMIKQMYKLKEEYQIKQLELQQKLLETKIKMLKEKMKTLTTTPSKTLQDSVITYAMDPKIIVKTINYEMIRKKPIYMGLLMYYESEKMLNVKGNTNGNSGDSLSLSKGIFK